ncbi:glutathione S-transferase GstA [Aulographum hederae CBS 113979]|uniref:Glutathione S-transferase GstA n=1 Tax=Aulographum hederae CBS 113979 TaxID=1176131 RepID=A0A6G1HF12_9PEZI|nr:glutathione S-transferase GstA [Aulographum hederae CBS 113979]
MATQETTPDLTVYLTSAVNPYKVTILLEELGIPYKTKILNMMDLEHKQPAFLAINPNGRLPALVHKKPDGTEVKVWESAAILLYITDNFDPENRFSFERGSGEYYQMLSWLCWQVSGLGPSAGQATHFLHYTTEPVPYGLKRYVAETRRLYSVLETALTASPYLVPTSTSPTIADISCYPWIASAWWTGISLSSFPAVAAWKARMKAREGLQRGMNVPVEFMFDDEVIGEERYREVRGRLVEGASKWFEREREEWFRMPAAEPGKD